MHRVPETRGRHLDRVAWLYDPVLERLSFGREERFRALTLELLQGCPGDRVLDVGCGTGTLTVGIARRLGPDSSVWGIDAAPKMIRLARRKALERGVSERVRFRVGLAEALDFEPDSFDTVVNSMFAHHVDLELKERSFAEMYRVLRPGGRLLTADVDRPSTLSAALLGWGARWLLAQRELAENLRGELPRVMARAGFKAVRRTAQVYGLVSFYEAVKPGAAA